MIGMGSLATRPRELGRYLARDKTDPNRERIAWSYGRNIGMDHPEVAGRLMEQASGTDTGLKRRMYHLSVAFHPDDKQHIRDRYTLRRIADSIIDKMGWAEHYTVTVAHNDRAHPHIHIMTDRIHPTTGKRWMPNWDRLQIQKTLRAVEKEFGLQRVPGHLWRDPELGRPDPARAMTTGARRAEVRARDRNPNAPETDTASFLNRVRAEVGPGIRAAAAGALDWDGLHIRLSQRGYQVELSRTGDGRVRGAAIIGTAPAVETREQQPRRYGAALSRLGASLFELERAMGPYEPPRWLPTIQPPELTQDSFDERHADLARRPDHPTPGLAPHRGDGTGAATAGTDRRDTPAKPVHDLDTTAASPHATMGDGTTAGADGSATPTPNTQPDDHPLHRGAARPHTNAAGITAAGRGRADGANAARAGGPDRGGAYGGRGAGDRPQAGAPAAAAGGGNGDRDHTAADAGTPLAPAGMGTDGGPARSALDRTGSALPLSPDRDGSRAGRDADVDGLAGAGRTPTAEPALSPEERAELDALRSAIAKFTERETLSAIRDQLHRDDETIQALRHWLVRDKPAEFRRALEHYRVPEERVPPTLPAQWAAQLQRWKTDRDRSYEQVNDRIRALGMPQLATWAARIEALPPALRDHLAATSLGLDPLLHAAAMDRTRSRDRDLGR